MIWERAWALSLSQVCGVVAWQGRVCQGERRTGWSAGGLSLWHTYATPVGGGGCQQVSRAAFVLIAARCQRVQCTCIAAQVQPLTCRRRVRSNVFSICTPLPKSCSLHSTLTLLPTFLPAGFISQLGRAGAFNLSVSAWVPCGIMLTSLALTMSKDEDNMQVC